MHSLDTLELDDMRCRSKNFQKFLEISITARFGIQEKNFVSWIILPYLMMYTIYITQLCIFDFPKLAYYKNDASKCLAFVYSRNGINF